MNQSVMVFSNSTARAAAITSPSEGMVTYLQDTDLISVYESGTWRSSLSPRGGVLQVVTNSTATAVSNSTTTYADTTLTATITPKSATSRILCLVNQNGVRKISGANSELELQFVLPDASTSLISKFGFTNTTDVWQVGSISGAREYSSGATAALTFKTQFRNVIAAASVGVQSSGTSFITLIEIGA